MDKDSSKELQSIESPYAFICYSHADGEIMEADSNWLREQGISVWFDGHITGGAEWNDELAFHIQHCTWFLYFISPKSVESIHCRNELNYAQQHDRKIIAVEIAPTEIPAGLQLTLNSRQILFRHNLAREDFLPKLKEAMERKCSLPVPIRVSTDISGLPSLLYSNKRKMSMLSIAIVSIIAFILAFGVFMPTTEELDFEERDWIIVGELENRTKDPTLGESLGLSLRTALEQSKFANVVPNAIVQTAKSRMQQDPDAPLNRNTGIELAQREGAKAAIFGSVSQFGETYTINIELVNAINGSTVWVAASNADGLSKVLPAVDEISRQTREQLGESLANIESNSLPLAKVTTGDLEALRAYSLSQKSIARGDWEGGIDLLQRALDIDPEFAMAHGKMASTYFSIELFPDRAAEHWQLASDNRDRLSQREKLYVDASSAWLKTPLEMRSGWKSMSSLYPDQAVGFHNLGQVLRIHFADNESAAKQFAIAANLPNPWRFASFQYLAQTQVALGRFDEALKNFNIALEIENNPLDFGMADAYVALRQYDEAQQFINRAEGMESPRLRLEAKFRQLGLYADRSQIAAALELVDTMFRDAATGEQAAIESRVRASQVALLEHFDDRSKYRNTLTNALAFEKERLAVETGPFPKAMLTHLTVLTRIALRSGETDLAAPFIKLLRAQIPGNGFPVDQAYYELLEAELLLQQGKPELALERAHRSLESVELFQAHDTLARIHHQLGNQSKRLESLDWLIEHRGLAFAEQVDRYYGQLFNILDLASVERLHTELTSL